MKLTVALFILILSHAGLAAEVLPDIFYASSREKQALCDSSAAHSEAYWRKLVDKKITSLIQDGPQTVQNSFVSLSYLELFRHSSHEGPGFMSYVYANASHHLGRLVRFVKWPENHPLRKDDQKLVKGLALRVAAGTVNQELSKRLMIHSLSLYKELAWSLASASLCGPHYTLGIVSDDNLRDAFSSVSVTDFIRPFVTYEQTYLQKTMYSDFLIGSSARAKMLDEMRFISFNGEEHPAFAKWCEQSNCKTSSFDLKNRIEFDVWSIESEFEFGRGSEERIKNAQIEKVAATFLQLVH
jgi:hypothetical protein